MSATQLPLEKKSKPTHKKNGIFDRSIIEHRERVAAAIPMAKAADVSFIDALIPIEENIKISVRIYSPPLPKKEPHPTLFYVPGTAFVANESKFTRVICSHIALRAKCQVIVINHSLAPESQFPRAFEDAYHVMKFFIEKALYNINYSKIAVGGYSSGGNIATSMAIQAGKDGIPIAAQILLSPIVDLSRSLNAHKAFEEQDSDISEEFVKWFLSLYIPENANPKNPVMSPFWSEKSDLQRLPLTAIILAEYDRFRSDAEAYYEKLGEAGVYAKRLMLDGENHAYLWQKLEIIERVADDILAPLFGKTTAIVRPLSHTLTFVKPRLTIEAGKKIYCPEDREKEKQAMTPTLRAKL